MSRYDQIVRHWDWADKLWELVRESQSDEEFAQRLAAFSAKVTADVAADARLGEAEVSDHGMNGTALPDLVPEAGLSVIPPPIVGLSEA